MSVSEERRTEERQERVFSDELRRTAEAIVAKYPNSRSATLPLLFLAQSVEGYVTEAGMREVGEILGLTSADVLATASFYTMLKQRPQGEYLISVCRNISCTHLGSRRVIEALEERLGMPSGSTTSDGRFSLESAECLATCDGAPAMQVNYEDFLNMTPESAIELVDLIERGEELRSSRGDRVRTLREISYETALAGVQNAADVPMESERTYGGESPRMDAKPGFRPRVEGEPSA